MSAQSVPRFTSDLVPHATDASPVRMSVELLTLAPQTLKDACDLLADDLLGDVPVGQSPSHDLRKSILAQVLFESISRQKRKEEADEARK